MNQDQLIKIIDACCEIVDPVLHPEFIPLNGVTHCNEAVAFVARKIGYHGFDGLVANDIFSKMLLDDQWLRIVMASAQEKANQGAFVVAGMHGEPHGHVCVIRPGIAKYSDHWNFNAPMCANVGGENFIGRGSNFAFQEIPRFFCLNQ